MKISQKRLKQLIKEEMKSLFEDSEHIDFKEWAKFHYYESVQLYFEPGDSYNPAYFIVDGKNNSGQGMTVEEAFLDYQKETSNKE